MKRSSLTALVVAAMASVQSMMPMPEPIRQKDLVKDAERIAAAEAKRARKAAKRAAALGAALELHRSLEQ